MEYYFNKRKFPKWVLDLVEKKRYVPKNLTIGKLSEWAGISFAAAHSLLERYKVVASEVQIKNSRKINIYEREHLIE